jgi:hypothetical protein
VGGGPKFEFTPQGGGEMPQVGLGTATMDGERCVGAVVAALKSGCRLLDTALLYANQEEVGEGIKKSGVDRKEIWVSMPVSFSSTRPFLFPVCVVTLIYQDRLREVRSGNERGCLNRSPQKSPSSPLIQRAYGCTSCPTRRPR